MPSDAPLWVACTTVALEDDARRLAREAVSLGLAACAQWEAIRSCYRWDGQVQDEAEWRLTFKTLGHALPSLHDWVHAHHPYALPQWVAWPVQGFESLFNVSHGPRWSAIGMSGWPGCAAWARAHASSRGIQSPDFAPTRRAVAFSGGLRRCDACR